jgi:hypothetical protein
MDQLPDYEWYTEVSVAANWNSVEQQPPGRYVAVAARAAD